jgi:hypothetical protein
LLYHTYTPISGFLSTYFQLCGRLLQVFILKKNGNFLQKCFDIFAIIKKFNFIISLTYDLMSLYRRFNHIFSDFWIIKGKDIIIFLWK